jgi:hypothetical protein
MMTALEWDMRASLCANPHRLALEAEPHRGDTHGGFCRRLAVSDVCPQSGFEQAVGG